MPAETRRVTGEVVFPADAHPGTAVRVVVEVRDVSLQDRAAPLVASITLERVAIEPLKHLPFTLDVANAPSGSALAMRVQVDMQEDKRHASGDYLSTITVNVPTSGDATGVMVPVTRL